MTYPLALALIHGVLSDDRMWRGVEKYLPSWLDVRIPVLPEVDQIEAMASALLAGLPEKFALCGGSMGGFVALEIMRQAPDRVTHLALVVTTAAPDSEDLHAIRDAVDAFVDAGEYGPGWCAKVHRYIAHANRNDGALIGPLLQMMLDTTPKTLRLYNDAMRRRRDYRPLLADIQCPTLVLAGAEDRTLDFADQEFMAQRIPGARLEVLSDTGHLPMLERPACVAALLKDLLGIQEFDAANQG